MNVCAGRQKQFCNFHIAPVCSQQQRRTPAFIHSVELGTNGKQQRHNVSISIIRRLHQAAFAGLINGIHIRAGSNQHFHAFSRVSASCEHQRSSAIFISSIHLCTISQSMLQRIRIAIIRSLTQRPVCLLHTAGSTKHFHTFGIPGINSFLQTTFTLKIKSISICSGGKKIVYHQSITS